MQGKWQPKYDKDGKPTYFFAAKKEIADLTAKDIKKIQDERLRDHIQKQLDNNVEQITDFKGRPIRHVRLKEGDNTGRFVKERRNYRSKFDHKNYYYASAGEILYALLCEKILPTQKPNASRAIKRAFHAIPLGEIAHIYSQHQTFNADLYIQSLPAEEQKLIRNYTRRLLLKVGQKVIVLKSYAEEKRKTDLNFQNERLYIIKQFATNSRIKVQYHLESRPDKYIKEQRKADGKTVQPSKLLEEQQPIILLPYDKAILLCEGIDFEMAVDGSITWV